MCDLKREELTRPSTVFFFLNSFVKVQSTNKVIKMNNKKTKHKIEVRSHAYNPLTFQFQAKCE